MKNYSISTFKRYVYINMYAILILIMGMVIIFLPLSQYSSYLIYLQILLFLICLKASFKIFSSWKAKKRRYMKLIQENMSCFNPSSFEEYMKAPCGRLLVNLVLKDLGYQDQYHKLKIYKISWNKTVKENFKVKKIVVYKNKD